MTMKKILKEWKTFTEAVGDESQTIMNKMLYALGEDPFQPEKGKKYKTVGSHRKEFEEIVGLQFIAKMEMEKKNKEKDVTSALQSLSKYRKGMADYDPAQDIHNNETGLYATLKKLEQKAAEEQAKSETFQHAINGVGLYVARYLSNIQGVNISEIFQKLSDLKAKIFLESLSSEETKWLKENFYSFLDEVYESVGLNMGSVWTGDVTARGRPTPKKGKATIGGSRASDWFWANPRPWPNGAYDVFVTSVKKQLKPSPRREVEPEQKPSTPTPEKSERAKELDDFFSRFYGGK